MLSNDFFEYVVTLGKGYTEKLISGRTFGNYVIVLDDITEAESRINSLRWDHYITEFFNEAFDYIPKKHF